MWASPGAAVPSSVVPQLGDGRRSAIPYVASMCKRELREVGDENFECLADSGDSLPSTVAHAGNDTLMNGAGVDSGSGRRRRRVTRK